MFEYRDLTPINFIVDFLENIIAVLYFSQEVVVNLAWFEHIGEHVEALDVWLKAAAGVFDRRALVDLERPVGGLGEK